MKKTSNIENGMILAAGRGNRLRPFTDTLPKPLIEWQPKLVVFQFLTKMY